MKESVVDFYDLLADSYHEMYADWRTEVLRQGKILDAVIRRYAAVKATPLRVLDCTCGIGTQAIAIATQGHLVHATDISPASVDRARKEAQSFGVRVTFEVADVRELTKVVREKFDVVVACDNSFSHLFTESDLLSAATQVRSCLENGGIFLMSIRDYDVVLSERSERAGTTTAPLPGTQNSTTATKCQPTLPRVFNDPDGRRIIFQIWDWDEDEKSYAVNHFHLKQRGTDVESRCYVSRFRAWRREQISGLLSHASFRSVEWLMPEQTGYYQPIAIALNHR